MRLLRRLEDILGRFAIPNLTVVLIVSQVAASIFIYMDETNELFQRLSLVPNEVLVGEFWRLISFLTLPPATSGGPLGLIFAFFFWYIFYLMGTALEHFWGTFRFNLYLLIWYVATVAAAFLSPNTITTNLFLQTSVFLAFAWLYPDFELRLMFLLPIRIKWLALFTWIMLTISAVSAFMAGQYGTTIAIVASFANFFLFFGKDLVEAVWLADRRVSRVVKHATHEKSKSVHHRCTVCGKTDASDPDEDFRYCSQCVGQHAYCSEHLREHEHLREG